MTLSDALWQANQDLAQDSLAHPFVQGIADGSLTRERFAYYIGQDAFYLDVFARAYNIAGAKAPDRKAFYAFHELTTGVLEELRLHESYAGEWGIRDVEGIVAGPATRRYTDFLLATAWRYDSGVTAVAMAPCMRLYAFLGQELARPDVPDHRYADWIRTYNSLGFTELVGQLETLVDRYAADTPLVWSTYRYAMFCECDFFEAAWQSQDQESLDLE